MNKIEEYIDYLMKESKPERPIWHIEAIKMNKKPVWNYVDGCMMTAFLSLFKTTKDDKYINYVKNFIDYFIDENGNIKGFDINKKSLDDISESRVLFDLYDYFNEPKYLEAIFKTYEQIKIQPRTYTDNFWHKEIYPDQVWLDGLYMVLPFYSMYDKRFNNYMNNYDIINQFESVRENLYSKKYKLYYHAKDFSLKAFWAHKSTGLSKGFWGRSIGWLAAALVDVYENIEEKFKIKIKRIYVNLIKGLMNYQDSESKLFYQIINKKDIYGNYIEISASSLISYSLMKAHNLKMLDESYYNIGYEMFCRIHDNYLIKDKEGIHLNNICLVAGLGPDRRPNRDGSIDYYISEPIVSDEAKGSAIFLMAYSEVIKKGEENEKIVLRKF